MKKCRRTEQNPQRHVWKGQLDPEEPSANALPRKHRAGLPGYTLGVKGAEWRETERKTGSRVPRALQISKPWWSYVSEETNPAAN